jgi:segregation and condensation protein B
MEAEIQVPAHQPYDMDIVERIVQRYEKILEAVGNAQQKNEKKNGL